MIKQTNQKIVPIDWIDESEQFALIPGHINNKKIRRIKELKKAKGNCSFAHGVSKNLIDFIYRAVTRLGLKNKKFLFSRGAVKRNNRSIINAVGISELDWDVGISMRIPRSLNYNHRIRLLVDKEERHLRLMEIIVLSALLHISYPKKNAQWCSNMSASIIAKGWDRLDAYSDNIAEVHIL